MNNMITKLNNIYIFLTPKVSMFMFLSFLLGVINFLVEVGFVFVLQILLVSLGIMDVENTFLKDYSQVSMTYSLVALIVYGGLRMIVVFSKLHLSNLTNYAFVMHQRKNILEFGLSHFSKVDTALTTSLFTEIIIQSSSLMALVSGLIISSISCVLLLGYGFRIAPNEMFIGIVGLVVLVLPLKFLSKRVNKISTGLLERWNEINKILTDGLKNNFLLAVTGRVGYEVNKGKSVLDKYYELQVGSSAVHSLLSSFPQFVGVFLISIICYFSTKNAYSSNVTLISFIYLFVRIAQAASEALGAYSLFRLLFPSLKKLYRWQTEKKLENSFLNKALKKGSNQAVQKIAFENISFSYEDSGVSVLKNLTFESKSGDIVVIKGPSGSGKSTILALMLGLFEPTSGNIRFNDKENLRVSSNQYGYVGSEAYILPGTVRENILLGGEEPVADELIIDALRMLKLDKVLLGRDRGLDYYLNEHVQLSTGQKQRLSIARAILRNPSVLIFDEATANLDLQTEREIMEEILPLIKGKIFFVVAHKTSYEDIATVRVNL